MLLPALILSVALVGFAAPDAVAASDAVVAPDAGAAPSAETVDCGAPAYAAAPSDKPMLRIDLPVVPRYQGLLSHDSVEIPNGRPVYALIVHGYSQNREFNQLLCYNFAKHIMEEGGYVHWAWWNNLCREYMARPLHHQDAHPGKVGLWGMLDGLFDPEQKGLPTDDYQFQADAKLFLETIRDNNPDAIIVVIGHSMGGAAVTRIGSDTDVAIDILAPLDPVGNRSSPWIGNGGGLYNNWTRHRIGREDLVPGAPFPPNPEKIRRIKSTVANLFHAYQKEYEFPRDYGRDDHFLHTPPPGGTTTQYAVDTYDDAWEGCGANRHACTMDGHGEIVGYRGVYNFQSYPDGLGMRGTWPQTVSPADQCLRRRLLMEMPYADHDDNWKYRPMDPSLCMVSDSLIARYERVKRQRQADPGDGSVASSRATTITAFPNPFNNSTHVAFELPRRERVSLQIFDLRGRRVRTLEERSFDAGRHEVFWDGTNDAGRTVASGPYFVRMRAGARAEYSKILLLK
jgi:pimeloyl-ACP methyl ester carboxylesterase